MTIDEPRNPDLTDLEVEAAHLSETTPVQSTPQPSPQPEAFPLLEENPVTELVEVFKRDSVKQELQKLLQQKKALRITAILVISLVVLSIIGLAASIINHIPVFNALAEVVGAFYCLKFIYEYLLFAEGRQILKEKLAELVAKVTGDQPPTTQPDPEGLS